MAAGLDPYGGPVRTSPLSSSFDRSIGGGGGGGGGYVGTQRSSNVTSLTRNLGGPAPSPYRQAGGGGYYSSPPSTSLYAGGSTGYRYGNTDTSPMMGYASPNRGGGGSQMSPVATARGGGNESFGAVASPNNRSGALNATGGSYGGGGGGGARSPLATQQNGASSPGLRGGSGGGGASGAAGVGDSGAGVGSGGVAGAGRTPSSGAGVGRGGPAAPAGSATTASSGGTAAVPAANVPENVGVPAPQGSEPEPKTSFWSKLVGGNKTKRPAANVPTLSPDAKVTLFVPRPPGVTTESRLLVQMTELVSNPIYSDVTFYIDDRPIRAHRAILAARCGKFKEMFETGATEFDIPATTYEAFKALLTFLYTERMLVDMQTTFELLGLSDRFGLGVLKGVCVNHLHRHMFVDNVAYVYQGAITHHAEELQRACLNYIVEHFDEVSTRSNFQALPRDALVAVLQRRAIVVEERAYGKN